MLPQGGAKRITIYLNEDTRSHLEPLWVTTLNFLRHKHVAGATMFRAEAGFGTHEQLHGLHSEYTSEHLPVRIEFIETAERVDELLPSLYDMVSDGLIVSQDVTVIKAVSRDRKREGTEDKVPRRAIVSAGKHVRIYLGESDRWKEEPLYEAIVKKLRMMGFAGATVYRGILGYGAKGHTHKSGHFGFSRDLPVMISVLEKTGKIDELVRMVSEMMQDGLIVTSDAELHEFVHEIPKQERSAE